MKIKFNGKEYEAKEFCDKDIVYALSFSQDVAFRPDNFTSFKFPGEAVYRPLFIPEIAKAKINAKKPKLLTPYFGESLKEDYDLIGTIINTPSLKATGKTKKGNKVVIYAHIPNHFSAHWEITKARKEGLINGAGRLPQNEFQRLIDLDGLLDENKDRLVWVINYNKLKKSPSGNIKVDQALEHPQTIPFLGGEKIAIKYLEKQEEFYDDGLIVIFHSDDLGNEPLGRLLSFEGGCLRSDSRFDDNFSRFIGIPLEIIAPENLEQKVLVRGVKK